MAFHAVQCASQALLPTGQEHRKAGGRETPASQRLEASYEEESLQGTLTWKRGTRSHLMDISSPVSDTSICPSSQPQSVAKDEPRPSVRLPKGHLEKLTTVFVLLPRHFVHSRAPSPSCQARFAAFHRKIEAHHPSPAPQNPNEVLIEAHGTALTGILAGLILVLTLPTGLASLLPSRGLRGPIGAVFADVRRAHRVHESRGELPTGTCQAALPLSRT